MTALARYRSPLGPIAVEASDEGVCALHLGARTPARPPVSALTRRHVEDALAALEDYFAGRAPPRLPAFDLRGTEFERTVWEELLRIPFGETRTYGEIALALGRPGAARAVGAANGRNPVAILVPCHRVVQAGGRLGGYAGGLDAKRWLLAHEAAHAPLLRVSR
ncbi:methylated-DNA--[protein]-cysteine S-methyltransferase [Anaeromyxobacter paludicola]|uniref:Methylated-DNA--protein-cysteine methyltransferase n=1 Tax=Anaeromyxobacter paludicola TaxID=2918171 RepID=A0ABN6NCV3_9BACT|nr:methylated-DNA--[protein]-cysteine S-methyltransferase [Anaeromyxobacter paludicola]BDG09802.1 methylated-DNA--protein-cysteine methyltransferase [Anaeromyxobacter paludicola]